MCGRRPSPRPARLHRARARRRRGPALRPPCQPPRSLAAAAAGLWPRTIPGMSAERAGVGVLGLGAMGSRIAARLLERGQRVLVWNRSPQPLARLSRLGAEPQESPRALAGVCSVVITMVSDPGALAEVSSGPLGLAAGAGAGLLVVEMSTVGPQAVAALRQALPAAVALLDAPVLGSLAEAEEGRLQIFVGGPHELAERARPLLAELGTVWPVGSLGSGAAAKLVANSTLFGSLVTLGEALALGRALGLSQESCFQVISTTPLAAQLERRRAGLQPGGPSRVRFSLRLALKDAELVQSAVAEQGLELPGVAASRAWLRRAQGAARGERDYSEVLQTMVAAAAPRAVPGRRPRPRPASAVLEADGLIVDLDGVVWRGGVLIPGARLALAEMRQRGIRIAFLTNDTHNSRRRLAQLLTALGVPAIPSQVFTAGTAAVRALQAEPGLTAARVLVAGPRALRGELRRAGFAVVRSGDPGPVAAVVVSGHQGFNFEELVSATRAARAGAPLLATGRDPVYPTADGVWPATGAMLAAVETASGVRARLVGKPEPLIFELAREALPGARKVVVVGDNLEADVAGARRAGLQAVLVLSGVSSEADLLGAATLPDLTLPSLAELPRVLVEPRG
ncbi:MAG: HAD-IIA family hydrolase [Candidatus Dormibacteria bacterium]